MLKTQMGTARGLGHGPGFFPSVGPAWLIADVQELMGLRHQMPGVQNPPTPVPYSHLSSWKQNKKPVNPLDFGPSVRTGLKSITTFLQSQEKFLSLLKPKPNRKNQ
jgi:hypothetical protein